MMRAEDGRLVIVHDVVSHRGMATGALGGLSLALLRRLRLHARLPKPRIAEAGEADEHHNPGRSFGDRRSGKRQWRLGGRYVRKSHARGYCGVNISTLLVFAPTRWTARTMNPAARLAISADSITVTSESIAKKVLSLGMGFL
jgi:hypothetical protein